MASGARARSNRADAEREQVRDLVSKLTGARFEVVPAAASDSFPIKDIQWFMRCRNQEDIQRAPYLNSVWKLRDGPIWLESLAIGDTFTWIGSAYGEEVAADTLDMNFSDFGDKGVRRQLESKFPNAYRRIRSSELVAAEAGKKRHVDVELRSSGSKGIVVFTIAAEISDPKAGKLAKQVGACVEALREAYQGAMEL